MDSLTIVCSTVDIIFIISIEITFYMYVMDLVVNTNERKIVSHLDFYTKVILTVCISLTHSNFCLKMYKSLLRDVHKTNEMLIKFVYNQKKEVREKERERYFTERNRKIEGYFDERETVP